MANYCVYCHINKLNGKRYVGLTREKKPSDRWGANGINYKNCSCFYGAIQKYGWNNFEHIILETDLTEDEAIEAERKYIQLYNTMVPNGYNLTGGGEIKKILSDETRKKLSKIALGRKMSESARNKMSQSRMGHPGYNRKGVWMCDKTTHEHLQWFPSSIDAEKFLNHPNSSAHIRQVCAKSRSSAYGYFWEFGEDEIGGELPSHS